MKRQTKTPAPKTETQAGNGDLPIKEQLQQRLLDHYDLMMLFKVSRGTIYNWCRKGLLSYTKIGGRMYFDANDMVAMLQQNKQRYVPGKGR